ncbi:MAG: alpha/beta hydrolase [Halioglobus sp.]
MTLPEGADVASREEMLARANTPEARAMAEALKGFLDLCDTEEIAPSAGLATSTLEFISEPDGNKVLIRFIRPVADEPLPCVYYIHGGGMQAMSCFDGNYRAWGRIIAARGVAVAMVDFRNALTPSSAPEVAPYPAGLNDCVAGLKWLAGQAQSLGIDGSRIIVAGEKGGGNLTLATGMRLKRERRAAPDQGHLRPVPLGHRRYLAAARKPIVHREQRPAARPAQQQRRHGLRYCRTGEAQPAGMAGICDG